MAERIRADPEHAGLSMVSTVRQCLLILVTLTGMTAPLHGETLTETACVLKALADADRVVVFSLEPSKARDVAAKRAAEQFSGWSVVGNVVLVDATVQEKFERALRPITVLPSTTLARVAFVSRATGFAFGQAGVRLISRSASNAEQSRYAKGGVRARYGYPSRLTNP